MRITSWNVNGIRAILKKGFLNWLEVDNPDVLCLQEVKAFADQMPPEFKFFMKEYGYVWHAGTRPGYSGTAIFYKINNVEAKQVFDSNPKFHEDGRMIEIQFGNISLLNIYFPNGGQKVDSENSLDYKLKFYDEFIDYIEHTRKTGKSIITCGDFNIAHKIIDIARPKENANSIGFLPEEREKLDILISKGYKDVYREYFPGLADQYTWWSYRAGARPRNVGWRIDYFFISQDLLPKIKKIEHQTDVMGSDHCPISMEIEI